MSLAPSTYRQNPQHGCRLPCSWVFDHPHAQCQITRHQPRPSTIQRVGHLFSGRLSQFSARPRSRCSCFVVHAYGHIMSIFCAWRMYAREECIRKKSVVNRTNRPHRIAPRTLPISVLLDRCLVWHRSHGLRGVVGNRHNVSCTGCGGLALEVNTFCEVKSKIGHWITLNSTHRPSP